MKYKQYGLALAFLICLPVHLVAMPDFGPNGLEGLDTEQILQLEKGRIVLTVAGSTDNITEFLEASFLLEKPPAEVWALLYRTEDHHLYLRDTQSSRAVYKSLTRDLIEYRVRVLLVGTTFWLVHQFDWSARYMHWDLAPELNSGFKEFRGFWRLYPYKDGRTLARYGNRVSPAGVPNFIVDLFRKGGVVRALESLKLYVESGGSYRK